MKNQKLRLKQHIAPLSRQWILLLFVVISFTALPASEPIIQFDLPTTVSAEMNGEDLKSTNSRLARVTLRLSAMIDDPSAPDFDQWIVTCRPRQSQLRVVDYAPRTVTGTDVVSPMKVKELDETNTSLGLSLDGNYGNFARGNAGSDHSNKKIRSREFSRAAPVHAVSAAGTLDRGRGVYFKLRWTATQILEGEKEFQMTLDVPSSWRGGLMDVQVEATRSEKRFGSFSKQTVVVGAASFVVTIYPTGDAEAERLARTLALREDKLRQAAIAHRSGHRSGTHGLGESPLDSLGSMVRYAARRFQGDEQESPTQSRLWLARLLSGRADPHLDREIVKLPMSLRIAALDFADARKEFQYLEGHRRIVER